jgi:hypothetical protein
MAKAKTRKTPKTKPDDAVPTLSDAAPTLPKTHSKPADAAPTPKKKKHLAAVSIEERKRLGRIGGLVGRRDTKGFASMTPERRSAIARMGALARMKRHVFSREECVVGARLLHGDSYAEAAAYAAVGVDEPTTAENFALKAAREAEDITKIAVDAGRKVEPESPAVDALLAKHVPDAERPSGLLPVPSTERDPEILARFEHDLAAAREIRDNAERAAFQIDIGRQLAALTQQRREARELERRAELEKKLQAALKRRAERGLDDTPVKL